jgi:hypothetical protein
METPASAAMSAMVAVLPETSLPPTSSSGAAAELSALVVVMVVLVLVPSSQLSGRT